MGCCCANPKQIENINICNPPNHVDLYETFFDVTIEFELQFGGKSQRYQQSFLANEQVYVDLTRFENYNENYSYILQLYGVDISGIRLSGNCYTFSTYYKVL
jgi:hypothetical protein